MAYIIGLETEKNIKELIRRGYRPEEPPASLIDDDFDPSTCKVPSRVVQFWVDPSVFDVMNGPD